MSPLTALCARLSRWSMYLACLCLAGLLLVVVYGVVLRYAFNDAPPYVEQVALLLVISVSMFGAAAGVRDGGHIGLDSVVHRLPAWAQRACALTTQALVMAFAVALIGGGWAMAVSTQHSTIPTLGISEAFRYLPVIVAGVLIALFVTEHFVAQLGGQEVAPSWH